MPPGPKQAENKRTVKCRNCGGNFPHKNGPCPAKGRTCNYCKKQNNFVVVCMKKKQKERRINQTDAQENYESETEENSNHDSDDSYFCLFVLRFYGPVNS